MLICNFGIVFIALSYWIVLFGSVKTLDTYVTKPITLLQNVSFSNSAIVYVFVEQYPIFNIPTENGDLSSFHSNLVFYINETFYVYDYTTENETDYVNLITPVPYKFPPFLRWENKAIIKQYSKDNPDDAFLDNLKYAGTVRFEQVQEWIQRMNRNLKHWSIFNPVQILRNGKVVENSRLCHDFVLYSLELLDLKDIIPKDIVFDKITLDGTIVTGSYFSDLRFLFFNRLWIQYHVQDDFVKLAKLYSKYRYVYHMANSNHYFLTNAKINYCYYNVKNFETCIIKYS